MSEIRSVHQHHPSAEVGNRNSVKSTVAPKCNECHLEEDIVEFSSARRTNSRLTHESSLRAARVESVKQEIAQGTYETPWRIRGTVERLLDVIA